ncbi:hypothetical protein VTN96DRAFT_3062 [Rasamsonia emersonii]
MGNCQAATPRKQPQSHTTEITLPAPTRLPSPATPDTGTTTAIKTNKIDLDCLVRIPLETSRQILISPYEVDWADRAWKL